MRRPAAVGTLLVVLAVLVTQLLDFGGELEYRRALFLREPWRLFTAHFVHLSLIHAMLNAVALLLLARLFENRLRRPELCLLLLVAPILISVVFWIAMPGLAWYRGLSGVLHAIYFAGCTVWVGTSSGRSRWLPVTALVGGSLKVLLEQPWDDSFPFREWLGAAVVPQAHLIGAVVGTLAGLCLQRIRGTARRHMATIHHQVTQTGSRARRLTPWVTHHDGRCPRDRATGTGTSRLPGRVRT